MVPETKNNRVRHVSLYGACAASVGELHNLGLSLSNPFFVYCNAFRFPKWEMSP